MDDRRRVVLLGATGSIGRQACDVIARFPERFQLVGAVAGSDARALEEVADRFGVAHVALVNPRDDGALPSGWGRGIDAACEVAAVDCDVVCVAITGAAALQPALTALDAGRLVAIATKEVLVMAGDLVRERAARSGARIIPVDSEHSALWQCLRGESVDAVARIVLTASGGPFLSRSLETFAEITPAEALAHPTWRMGPKVTIDSATMMNKGLEVIEAHFLFDVDYTRVDVAIHPDSLVHSYVEFCDGAILAQIGVPDMRVPISLALSDGERLPGVGPSLDLRAAPPLRLLPVDPRRFPAVALARAAGERGGVAPCVLNAANEVAVAAFLEGRCRFDAIVPLVAEAVAAAPAAGPGLEAILEADSWARERVRSRMAQEVAAS
ncbi:MAG: 1-deoxy-D-xylulose-5-phosphate reductoisomerase [Candidatus Dormibacteraeota bacterium]|nr:1-deoxy-D-xylulose-5-phosphate reductoisomerase [Candidatus Dormibacteraeota bacterium]MBV9524778.1 1-deoxy-D-xylulose-5-phosphate reductoisomerase [Candidatus Dormibacteraeota bacterium]